jgi:hypothetical protein
MAISACVAPAFGQDPRGRKYKAPPETAHIVVQLTKATNGKPVVNAAVVFHPIKDGKDEGNLEIKSDPDGKAAIDVIPIGSQVTVQVIASGFATYAEDFLITGPEKLIDVKLQRPKAQVSAYVDNSGKPSQMQPGVQEPKRPAPAPQAAPQGSANPTPQANSTTSSAPHQ